uniref:Serine and arginine rich splicing factor 3 n=1 Tax=Esox lucius TaxID=8010 RepID=A0AAY5KGU0_ESOLU
MHRDCPLDCKVYVGNLGNNGNKTELERSFGYYGPLRSVWVARNPPGFAFVEFEDPRDATDAEELQPKPKQISLQRQEEGEIFVPGQEPQTIKIFLSIKEVGSKTFFKIHFIKLVFAYLCSLCAVEAPMLKNLPYLPLQGNNDPIIGHFQDKKQTEHNQTKRTIFSNIYCQGQWILGFSLFQGGCPLCNIDPPPFYTPALKFK